MRLQRWAGFPIRSAPQRPCRLPLAANSAHRLVVLPLPSRRLKCPRTQTPDSDVDKHEQTQHPLNNPTSMDDAGSNDTEQDQSQMTSHDSAALAYISAAVDSLCGVAKRHGHTVVSFEAYHSKVVLGNSNTARAPSHFRVRARS